VKSLSENLLVGSMGRGEMLWRHIELMSITCVMMFLVFTSYNLHSYSGDTPIARLPNNYVFHANKKIEADVLVDFGTIH
jgi:hypothetical protein